jgi:hypothetical protein
MKVSLLLFNFLYLSFSLSLSRSLALGYMRGVLVDAAHLRTHVELSPHRHLLIVDTNIALHQIDVLEHDCPATGKSNFS